MSSVLLVPGSVAVMSSALRLPIVFMAFFYKHSKINYVLQTLVTNDLIKRQLLVLSK